MSDEPRIDAANQEHAQPAKEEMKKQGDALSGALEPGKPQAQPDHENAEPDAAPAIELPTDVTPKSGT